MKSFRKTLKWHESRAKQVKPFNRQNWQTQLGALVQAWKNEGFDENDRDLLIKVLERGACLGAGHYKTLCKIAFDNNREDLFHLIWTGLSFERSWHREDELKAVLNDSPGILPWVINQGVNFNNHYQLVHSWVKNNEQTFLQLLQNGPTKLDPNQTWQPVIWKRYLEDCNTFSTAKLLVEWGVDIRNHTEGFEPLLHSWIKTNVKGHRFNDDAFNLTQLYIDQGGPLNSPKPVLNFLERAPYINNATPWIKQIKNAGGIFTGIPSCPSHLLQLIEAGFDFDLKDKADYLQKWVSLPFQIKKPDPFTFYADLAKLHKQGMNFDIPVMDYENPVDYTLNAIIDTETLYISLEWMKLGVKGPSWEDIQPKAKRLIGNNTDQLMDLENQWQAACALQVQQHLHDQTPSVSKTRTGYRM